MSMLLLSEIFPPKTGGSGRWFWEVYRRLPRTEVLIAGGQDPNQESFDRSHDLRVLRIPLGLRQWGLRSLQGLGGYARAVWKLRQVVKAEHVREVHCGRCLPEGLMALALKLWYGLPYICYAHGEEINCASTSRELSWLIRRVLDGARLVIANSRNTRRLLQEEWRLPDDRLALLHPGVDTDWFVPAPRDLQARAHLGWGNRPVVLTVGRLQRRKGHDQMIHALQRIRQVIPEILYAVVGNGEERLTLEELVRCLRLGGHVRFHGELDEHDLRQCYQQCDLFVLPNRQIGKDIEGFGMVLLEAQACGKPVVAGDSGGTAETMCIPETGQVVPCDEPNALAGIVMESLAEPQRLTRRGVAGRQWTVERFSWKMLSQEAYDLFRRAASLPYSELPPSHAVAATRSANIGRCS